MLHPTSSIDQYHVSKMQVVTQCGMAAGNYAATVRSTFPYRDDPAFKNLRVLSQ